MTLELLDYMLRSASTALFLMIAILIIRDFGWRLPAMLGAWSALTGASYTICTTPWHTQDLGIPFWLIEPWCVTGPISIWLFSLSQFRDDFRLQPFHFGMAFLYLASNRLYVDYFYMQETIAAQMVFVLYTMTRVVLIGHMVYAAWQGRADDLMEVRRRFRMRYIVLVSIITSVILVLETFYGHGSVDIPYVSLVQASGLLFFGMIIFWHVTQAKQGILLFSEESTRAAVAAPVVSATTEPAENLDLVAIRDRMVTDKLYLQPGLTIAALAKACGLPEHRLRKLINQHLGYRNFSDYLNAHRVEDAETRLSDASNRNVPILTIAMDLGYGSVGPFNRAFKERTGQTPSEYRRAALARVSRQ